MPKNWTILAINASCYIFLCPQFKQIKTYYLLLDDNILTYNLLLDVEEVMNKPEQGGQNENDSGTSSLNELP